MGGKVVWSLEAMLVVGVLVLAGCQAGTRAPGVTPATVTEALVMVPTVTTSAHVTHGVTEAATELPSELPTEVTVPDVTATVGTDTGQFDIAQAKSVNVVAGPGERVYVLAGRGNELWLYQSDDGGQSFGEGTVVSQGTHAEVLAVVMPGLAVGTDETLAVAWVEFGDAGVSRVRAAYSEDSGASFGEAANIAETTDPETTMASVAFDAANQPLVTWLQNSSVRVAASGDAGTQFGEPQILDDLVCECCQPAPLVVGERVFVAYRNLIRDGAGQVTRDIFVAASEGGATFGEPVPVSDGTWPIDACPIAGPALAELAGTLYVAWMDGRFDDGTFSSTDVWVAASTDGGASFGPNVRVNAVEGFYNGQPALGIDGQGWLHIAWAAETPEGDALQYAVSNDGGQSFSAVQTVVSGADRLGSVGLTVTEAGSVILGWTDTQGAHVRPVK